MFCLNISNLLTSTYRCAQEKYIFLKEKQPNKEQEETKTALESFCIIRPTQFVHVFYYEQKWHFCVLWSGDK